jgi:F0F1-type ATP synthase membrane subunit b/b'
MQESTQAVDNYSGWTNNESFAVASSALLFLLFGTVFWFLIKSIITNINKKIDDIKETIKEIVAIKDKALEMAGNREARLIDKITDCKTETLKELGRNNEKLTTVITSINILIGKELNGK